MRNKPIIYVVLILLFLLSGSIFSSATDNAELSGKEIFLYTGSPLILSGGEVKMLDSTNPDIGATVIQSRTLVPLRALSEYFGAEVSYDKANRAAIIIYDGKQYVFPIDEKKYIVERSGKKTEFVMDSQSMIINGRTMVPLRAFCENVLGSKVSYYNRVIAIADKEIQLKANVGLMENVQSKIGEAVKAFSVNELQQVLTAGSKENVVYAAKVDMAVSKSSAMGSAPESSNAFSSTNVQVRGIDEADVVKTDGKYIYIAGNNVVRIVGADQGKLSDDTAIRLATNKSISEIYVADDKLVIIGTKWDKTDQATTNEGAVSNNKMIGIAPPYYYQRSYSFIDVYNITNPLKPMFVKGHEMEGNYQSSRKIGELVYMVTNTGYQNDIFPMVKDTVSGNNSFKLALDDVMIMPRHPSNGYLIISAMNINNNEKTEVEAITAYGSILYMNDSGMYLALNDFNNYTSIIKFEFEGMKVGYAGSGKVKGYLLNQFSMDEYQGNLRVATTTVENGNGVYILDQSLNQEGFIEGLAKDETIYSVRFIEEKGYVVTYRRMDPLFVFDLSDPQKPVVTGELEIPGFSNYLHPIGKDLILGIGIDTYDIYRRDSNGKEIVVGSRQGGIKFSLFDISEAGKPKEISKQIIGTSGSYSEALDNHKAIMVDEASEKIAFDAYLAYENQAMASQQGAIVMGFGGKELTLKGILKAEDTGTYGNDIPYARRVIYIGDEIYYIQGGRITSYNYDSLKKIDDLVLQ